MHDDDDGDDDSGPEAGRKTASSEKLTRDVLEDPKFEALLSELVSWCDVSLPILQSMPQNDVERALSVLLGLKCCGEYFASLRANDNAASANAGGEEAEEEKEEGAALPNDPSSSCAGQGVAYGAGKGSGGVCYGPVGPARGDLRHCRFSEPMLLGKSLIASK